MSTRRNYWRWSKQDFFPEPSFENLTSYKTSLSQTYSRLKDRITYRSTQEREVVELQAASENDMKRCLNWWDLLWLTFGAVVGSGIFVITGQEAHDHAGPAIVLSYGISGFSALLSVLCYAEFGVEIPVAGGAFSYLRIELGDFIAFVAAGNVLLEAIVGNAGLARSWSSYLGSMIKNEPNLFRFHVKGLAHGFNYLDPLAVAVLVITNAIATVGARQASTVNWISSIISSGIIVFVIAVGFSHAKTSNLSPFFPNGAGGVLQAAAVVFWSYTGFDLVATMAEETKNPTRDIPIGLLGGMSVVTMVYCLMSLALTMMVKYTDIDRDAAYSAAFVNLGMTWAKYIVSLCALKGMTSAMLVGALGQARYMTQIARAHMVPPWFALVHPKTNTPVNASLMLTALTVPIALFSSLDVLSSVLSFSTLFIFMLMAIALLVRRYYVRDVTSKKQFSKFLACLVVIVGSCIGGTAVWMSNKGGWISYAVCGLVWVLGTLGLSILPQERVPQQWGVPLVPWMPSLSIATNVFLLGSLGQEAFWRFVICSVVMLVYYLFVGLHATYDMAHPSIIPQSKAQGGNNNVDQQT